MVERVIVNPVEVRGLGDVVSPKTLSDFGVHSSTLSSSVSDDGDTVYSMSYLSGSYFTLSGDGFIFDTGEVASFSVSAVLKYLPTDSLITSSNVSCIVNDTTVLTGTTNSSGKVTFTVPVEDDVKLYRLRFVYEGNSNVAGCISLFKCFLGDIDSITLIVEKSITQTNEIDKFASTVTGTMDEKPVPIPGVTVKYFAYNPRLFDFKGTLNPVVVDDNNYSSVTVVDEDIGDTWQISTGNYWCVGADTNNCISLSRTGQNYSWSVIVNGSIVKGGTTAFNLMSYFENELYIGSDPVDISSYVDSIDLTNLHRVEGQMGVLTFVLEAVDSWINQTGTNMTYTTTGTHISGSGSTGFSWAKPANSGGTWDKGVFYSDVTVDVDIVSTNDSYCRILFYESYSTSAVFQAFYVEVGHNQIVKEGNTYTHYVNGVQKGQVITKDLKEPLRIGFGVTDGKNVVFKNFYIGGY